MHGRPLMHLALASAAPQSCTLRDVGTISPGSTRCRPIRLRATRCRVASEHRPEPGPRDSSGHARRRRALSGHGSGSPTPARCDPELAKGFGACRREGSCRRPDGGVRIGFLSPLRVFRFAGRDAHGSATYITCGSSAGKASTGSNWERRGIPGSLAPWSA